MSKLRGLELCCKAGGSGEGYRRAGFDMVGVDITPQPRYPFEFMQRDALTLEPAWIAANFDFVHASPPCQGYTDLRHAPGAKGAPRLIGEFRELLRKTGLPYVIENVQKARAFMESPITLCGTMFGLNSQGAQLRRHRLFESNIEIDPPGSCRHDPTKPVIGVYGGHSRIRAARFGGRGTRDVWQGGHKPAAATAMGINWMTLAELSEAIPPAFTQHIGQQIFAHLQQARAAA